MRSFIKIQVILGLIIFLTACSNSTPAVTSPTAASINNEVATQAPDYPAPDYPAPVQPATPISSYPGPIPTLVKPEPAPTSTKDPSMGAVNGRLLEADKPAPNVILYLAEVVKDDSGKEMVVSYDRVTSPNTTTDDQGNFVFVNVKAGRYGLILDTVIDSYFLHYPGGTNEQILFSVETNQETDLGELNYDSLPLPPP